MIVEKQKTKRSVRKEELAYGDVRIQLSAFETGKGVTEYHVLLSLERPSSSFEQQLKKLQNAYNTLVTEDLPAGAVPAFRRYFLSDAANQTERLMQQERENTFCALSIVQQPPLNGTKIALWAYFLSEATVHSHSTVMHEVAHNGYRHLWSGGLSNKAANAEYQTRLLFNDYILQLSGQGVSLVANCIRTWLFVQNVDVNYAGVVKARREVFLTQNLNETTHYIASTGIEGRHADPEVLVQMDAYSVDGICPEQIQYLYAPTHLNPTYEYGVTFERGVTVTYGDRKQIYISGTASIDNRGEIVHPGNILKQTGRMLENIEVLLQEAGAGLKDVMQAIVYLRDTADYLPVKKYLQTHYPDLPHLIVLAPVCRPGWLIETECIAVTGEGNKNFKAF
ncbi:Rid family hydrolase [Parabacteroides sp. PF5-6]|uniref:Rid family hydrolase n=1 Tax=Parabacteroides sp. PF5-6 TaxID=1742403 RepID=UPI002404AE1B|nr:Rid family hydrolase [Parabacteroides sp. PF5-6]MDF9831753.1 enamine deaminase RidA (YjgF/YER057c/UK114 family) [Parabacteroides sp. PF5-6]